MFNNLKEFDLEILKEHKCILGLDEVGRGCVAGPLVVAGVILKNEFFDNRIKDSKKIKDYLIRKKLKDLIISNSLFWEVLVYGPNEVDEYNPKFLSKEGMYKIASKYKEKYDICLTDYEKIDDDQIKQINLIKGDEKSFSIACASILAKSTRDEIMFNLDKKFPMYNLLKNQGYFTKEHKKLLEKYGPQKGLHRFSYKCIKGQ